MARCKRQNGGKLLKSQPSPQTTTSMIVQGTASASQSETEWGFSSLDVCKSNGRATLEFFQLTVVFSIYSITINDLSCDSWENFLSLDEFTHGSFFSHRVREESRYLPVIAMSDSTPRSNEARSRSSSEALDAIGKLVLRCSLASLMLLHGVAKLQHGTSGIATMLTRKGWPPSLALGVYVGEVLAPLLMIVGIFTRPAALIFAFNMMVATWLVHAGDLGQRTTTGGWKVELQALYFFGAIAVAFVGAGRLSLSRGRGSWWR